MLRRRDPEGKREAVLEAALAIFVERGYHATKTSEIARRAGVAEGTVFRLFETKEALANAVYLRCDEEYAAFLPSPAQLRDEPRAQFAALWGGMVRFFRERPLSFTFYELHPHRDYLDDVGRLARQKHKAAVFELIRAWQKRGALRDEPHEALRALVIGSMSRLVREAAEGPFVVTDAMLDALERVCWDAISAKPARTSGTPRRGR